MHAFSRVMAGVGLLGAIGVSRALCADAPAPPPAESKWMFNLIPKPFQTGPRFEMTVFTDFTAAGKARPAASPQAPQYYALHSAGYRAVGALAQGKPLDPATVERHLRQSLATNGFVAADDAHPPSLLIVFAWGPHTFVASETADINPDAALRNLLDRAALVGGDKFANELGRAVNDRLAVTAATAPALGRGAESDSMDLGAAVGLQQLNAMFDPVKLFMQKSAKNEFLVWQTAEDCYYVVASAYDYKSVAGNHRELLWRTRMTVGLRGVAQAEAVPAVIIAGAPYLGRETPEPEVLLKRSLPRTKVEIGELTEVRDGESGKKK